MTIRGDNDFFRYHPIYKLKVAQNVLNDINIEMNFVFTDCSRCRH